MLITKEQATFWVEVAYTILLRTKRKRTTMELLLYRNYLKYLKDNRLPMSKAFKKLPKTMLVLLIILSVTVIGVIVILCIEKVRAYFYVALAIEAVVAFVVFLYGQHYEIENSNQDIKEYKNYCSNLFVWLENTSVSIDREDIIELKNRIVNRLEKYEQKQQRTYDTIIRFVQALIIPIVLTVLTVVLNKQFDISMVLAYGFIAIMIPSFFAVTLFGFTSFINLIRKNEFEKMKSFSSDLQGILDTQFDKGIFAKTNVED